MHIPDIKKRIHKLRQTLNERHGFILPVAVITLAIVFASMSVLISYSISGRNVQKKLEATYSALQIAEAGVQKALYCIKANSGENCGGTYGQNYAGENGINFAGGTYTVSVTDNNGEKNILATGINALGESVSTKVVLTTAEATTTSTQFDYAIQVGGNTAEIKNNAIVSDGPIYSASDIICDNNSELDSNVYISLSGAKIDNCFIQGDTYADNILNSKVCADAYFDQDPSGIDGTDVEGTEYPNSPTPTLMKLPDFNLAYWRQVARDGGEVTGNYAPGDNSTIGPIKIDGDLTLGNNVEVTITGPIWVTGNILLNNNSEIKLDPAFLGGSTVILADNPENTASGGKITLNNNTEIKGSGQDGSYIILVSTNNSLAVDGTGAIEVANNSVGDAIFYAMNGSVHLNNNAGASAVAGQRVLLDQNAQINYACSKGNDNGDGKSGGGGKHGGGGSGGGGGAHHPKCTAGGGDEGSSGEGGGDGQTCETPGDIDLSTGPTKWRFEEGTWNKL